MLLIMVFCSACGNSDQNRTHRLQWWLNGIHWDTQERNMNLSGKGITVAIIDTPIDESHPDLKEKIIEKHIVDGVSDSKNFEHGTAVAGIICASPNNKDGALGVAVDAKILSIVISDDVEARVDSLIKGIEYAITKKVNIINISAGIVENNDKLQSAINDAYNAGIVIVAASGNDLNGTILYPAKCEHVLSVSSIDSNNIKLFGEDNKSIYLPGGNIVTTYSSVSESKKYASFTGTSMSTPILSGVIALILEQNPNLTNKNIFSYFSNFQNREFNTVEILKDFAKIYK